MLKVAWLYVDRLGCGSYRVWIPALSLEESKFSSNSLIFQESVLSSDHFFQQALEQDVVVFQRAVSARFVELMQDCMIKGIKTVVEIDDWLFDVPRANPIAWYWNKKPIKKMLQWQLENCDSIIVSTPGLARLIADYLGWSGNGSAPTKIHVCYNHLHKAVWGPQVLTGFEVFKNTKTVIGWQGSTTHDQDFREAIPALKQILEERTDVVVRLMGDVPRSVKESLPTDRFEWTGGVPFERYPYMMKFINIDIGIAPATSSVFNSAKSNLKWLEYSALKVPCVASNIPEYEACIDHGSTGFVADNTDQWYLYLTDLLDSRELRKGIGEEAHKVAWSLWSSEVRIEPWMHALGSLCPIQSQQIVHT